MSSQTHGQAPAVLAFPHGPHPSSTPTPCPTESSPLSSGAWVRIACGKRLSMREPASRTSSGFKKPDPFCPAPCLSVCLSFPSLAPPHRKHNFPLSLSFPLLLNNRGPFFIPWAMATKCQQLGMWDAGPAGTRHRKKGLGRGRLRTGWTSLGKRVGCGSCW